MRVAIGLALVEQFGLALAAPGLEEARPGVTATIAATPYLTCWPESGDPAPFPVRRFADLSMAVSDEPLGARGDGLR